MTGLETRPREPKPKRVRSEDSARDASVVTPNFFLIGPPKAGTTAIAVTLARHPQVFVSDPKEPNFFVYQGGNPYGWDPRGKDDLDWYLGLFANAGEYKAVGDASPYYLACHHCAREIYKFNPKARIIAVMRNPVYRAFSMYRFWYTNSAHPISVEDFVASFFDESLAQAFEFEQPHRVGWLRDTGYYARHLQAYYDVFPAEQVKPVFYDQLVKDPQAFYRTVYDHLGVDPDATAEPEGVTTNVTMERRWRGVNALLNRGYHGPLSQALKTSPLGEMARRLRAAFNAINVKPPSEGLAFPRERYGELISVYLDDIARLETMLGVNLDGWRSGAMQ